jgi:hypothetical protein
VIAVVTAPGGVCETGAYPSIQRPEGRTKENVMTTLSYSQATVAKIATHLRTFAEAEADDNTEIYDCLESYKIAVDDLNREIEELSSPDLKALKKVEIFERIHVNLTCVREEIRNMKYHIDSLIYTYVNESGLVDALRNHCDAFLSDPSDENKELLQHCAYLCGICDGEIPMDIIGKLMACGMPTSYDMTYFDASMHIGEIRMKRKRSTSVDGADFY